MAHRLDTILDFDRVAVMEKGEIVEFEDPRELLQRASMFRSLYNSFRLKQSVGEVDKLVEELEGDEITKQV